MWLEASDDSSCWAVWVKCSQGSAPSQAKTFLLFTLIIAQDFSLCPLFAG
jgi:hypothetical protein